MFCNKKFNWKSSSRAFTLIELLVVIGIIAIFFGISIGFYSSSRENALISKATAEMGVIAIAIESFNLHYGDYPRLSTYTDYDSGQRRSAKELFDLLTGKKIPRSVGEGNDVVIESVSEAEAPIFLSVGHLSVDNPEDPKILLDPWGNPYEYFYKSQEISKDDQWGYSGFILLSAGPDAVVKNRGEPINNKEYFVGENADNIVHRINR